MDNRDKLCIGLLAIFTLVVIISGIYPYDPKDWVLEASIPVGVVILLIATYRKFKLTPLAYTLILLHSFILLYGAHYTYALTPLGEWVKPLFGWHRNNYDRLGHFAFGFFPAIVIRELIYRTTPLKKGKMLFFLVVCVVGAAGAFYELTEMWTALIVSPDTGVAYLGSQGDPWDAQWDMFWAFVGAMVGQAVFLIPHKRQMERYGYLEDAGEWTGGVTEGRIKSKKGSPGGKDDRTDAKKNGKGKDKRSKKERQADHRSMKNKKDR